MFKRNNEVKSCYTCLWKYWCVKAKKLDGNDEALCVLYEG